jgi:hypothetical protein
VATRHDLEVITGPLISPAHFAIHATKDQPCGLCGGLWADDCWWCRGTGRGGWVPYRWTLLLNRKLVDLAARRIKRLIVVAPVRSGKSELGTKYNPAWYQGLHPNHRQILTGHTDEFIRTFGRATRDLLQEHGPRSFVTTCGTGGGGASGPASSPTPWRASP